MIKIKPHLINDPIAVYTLTNHVFYTGVYNDELLIFIKGTEEVFIFNIKKQEFDSACSEDWISANVGAIRPLTKGEGFTIKIG